MNNDNLSREVILADKIHIGETLAPPIKGFLGDLLPQFRKEIQKVCDAFYSIDLEENGVKGANKIFAAIERTWVGILNNAIIRLNPNNTTLQEFAVWSDKELTGRCDMLFRILEEENFLDIFVEAKSYEYNHHWSVIEYKSHFKTILWQAYKYYEAEHEYYSAKNTYLMAVIFQWVREAEWLNQAEKKFRDETDLSDVDFMALYRANTRGLFVYGKIVSIPEFLENYSNR